MNVPSQKLDSVAAGPATGKAPAHKPGASSSNGEHGAHEASPPNSNRATQFTPDPRSETADYSLSS